LNLYDLCIRFIPLLNRLNLCKSKWTCNNYFTTIANFYKYFHRVWETFTKIYFIMSDKSQHISTDRSKHHLKCHLISVAKYRGNILVGQSNDDLKFTFRSMADNPDFKIEVFESDVDHIHFHIRNIPRLSVSQIVRRSEQGSRRRLWLLHHTTFASILLVSAFTLVKRFIRLFNR